VLFGAWGGTGDPNKGFDLLRAALRALAERHRGTRPIACVMIGGSGAEDGSQDWSFPVHRFGHVGCDERMAALYAAADVTVVPSRIENLPQMATEALSSGCPVAGFRTCGMPEAVEDRVCGTLAAPYDATALADGIAWIVADPARHAALRDATRLRGARTLGCLARAAALPGLLPVGDRGPAGPASDDGAAHRGARPLAHPARLSTTARAPCDRRSAPASGERERLRGRRAAGALGYV
jgi:glycosyltransferase involved in cell wall biosynthesis